MIAPRFSAGFGVMLLLVVALCTAGCSPGTNSEHPAAHSAIEHSSDTEVKTVRVILKSLERTVNIPAELAAYRSVGIYPKVQGFVRAMKVDRGAPVKKGDILVEIVAPELEANYREAQAKLETANTALLENKSKVQGLIAQREEAQSKLEAVEANYRRVQNAAKTEGAVAPVDLESAEKDVAGARAHVRSLEQQVISAQSENQTDLGRVRIAEQALNAVRETKGYLTIRAPFDGVISERNVHEGSLVSSSQSNPPMLRLEQISQLRLLVPVPESAISGVKVGSNVSFSVEAHVGKTFTGKVARVSHSVDRKTRTMMVEVDVLNDRRELEPGMYAEVAWTMTRPYQTMFVPSTAVLSEDDKDFVIRFRDNTAQRVMIAKGQAMGTYVEVSGDLRKDDEVALIAAAHSPSHGPVRRRLLDEVEVEKELSLKNEH